MTKQTGHHGNPGVPADFEHVVALLEAQVGLVANLDELSLRQAELIEAEDAEPLLKLLASRQGILDELAGLQAEFRPLRERWPQILEGFGHAQRLQIQRRLDGLAAAASQIARRDEEARTRLGTRRDELAAQIADVGRGRGALAAYSRPPTSASGPTFQDREA